MSGRRRRVVRKARVTVTVDVCATLLDWFSSHNRTTTSVDQFIDHNTFQTGSRWRHQVRRPLDQQLDNETVNSPSLFHSFFHRSLLSFALPCLYRLIFYGSFEPIHIGLSGGSPPTRNSQILSLSLPLSSLLIVIHIRLGSDSNNSDTRTLQFIQAVLDMYVDEVIYAVKELESTRPYSPLSS